MTVVASTGAFGELVRRHRATARLSQRELADGSGLSERAVRDLERGTRMPRAGSARLIAAALHLTGDDLRVFLAAARPGAPATPAWATAPGSPSGDLVGRDAELAMLLDLVTGTRHRLVTVTGRAGMGKSRLAAELAGKLAARTDLAVHTLDLSAVTEPELVGELVAVALGCGPSRVSAVERIAAHLRGERIVLMIDRFEQLVEAAPLLAALVRRCPGLSLVVTSQRRLQLRDERAIALRPLTVDAAVTLFARRASAAKPDFTLDRDTADTVAAICRQLECLPLAIELAAARVRLLHPAELFIRLDRQLAVLSGGARDSPARHRSLRAAIESSLDVVDAESRTLFRWLGAFAGGARLADVEAVTASLGRDRDWLLTTLAELTDTDLLRVVTRSATSRYTFPDSVAELAAERLDRADDREAVLHAVAVRVLDQICRGHEGSAPAVDERDAANVRRAVDWAVTHESRAVSAGTVTALARYYETTGRLAEGQEILCRLGAAGHAEAWVRAGGVAVMQGDVAAATDLARRGLRAAEPTQHLVRSAALNLLANAAVELGDPAAARIHLRHALREARRGDDLAMLGRTFNNLASLSYEMGNGRAAERQLQAALTAKRRCGAGPVDVGRTLFNLAEIALHLDRPDAAVSWSGEAVPLLRAGGYARLAALSETSAACAELRRGRREAALAALARARRLLAEDDGDDRRTLAALQLRSSVVRHATGDFQGAVDDLCQGLTGTFEHMTRDRNEIADVLQDHAGYLLERDPAAAAAMLGASSRMRARPMPVHALIVWASADAAGRKALGNETFEAERSRGEDLGQQELLALCQRIVSAVERPETATALRASV